MFNWARKDWLSKFASGAFSENYNSPSCTSFGISLPWLQVEKPSDLGMVGAIKMLVDEGEAEAIALAYERGFQIILDDRQARSVAKNLGISIIGTVGVLVKAKQAGLIPFLKPLLDELQVNGFYLNEDLKVEALKLVGEK